MFHAIRGRGLDDENDDDDFGQYLVDIFWFCKRCLINNVALVVLEVTVG